MGYQINVLKDAEKDIIIAKCHYRIVGLKDDLDNDFLAQMDYLGTNAFYYKNVRRVHFKEFKYSIRFIIQIDTGYILRLLHHKQKVKWTITKIVVKTWKGYYSKYKW